MSSEMTSSDAIELLRGDGWACACAGPAPSTGRLCWCQWLLAQANQLQRGAHIAARQISDLAKRREERASV